MGNDQSTVHTGRPVFQVDRGSPGPAELAALTVALMAFFRDPGEPDGGARPESAGWRLPGAARGDPGRSWRTGGRGGGWRD
ncbi:acyl-CoA carboxylase subunit epsilon [Streptomyces jumonjinensis]|uniref:Acyl-CoA carboxylase subunit epsilon n=1 Tax=Streptomyces jumonjinensis TaxID=1945 RepID=A0A646KMS8_STRJU|nr:acyl-CoA carboxylase subunit epsilon [Streptomyces jumonjinensis]MQT02286.1 acyl-CoA carboxylase subunit epsilon [Streptomyces jumonjinensis]